MKWEGESGGNGGGACGAGQRAVPASLPDAPPPTQRESRPSPPLPVPQIVYNAVYSQMTTLFILQGQGMDTALGSLNVAPATVSGARRWAPPARSVCVTWRSADCAHNCSAHPTPCISPEPAAISLTKPAAFARLPARLQCWIPSQSSSGSFCTTWSSSPSLPAEGAPSVALFASELDI